MPARNGVHTPHACTHVAVSNVHPEISTPHARAAFWCAKIRYTSIHLFTHQSSAPLSQRASDDTGALTESTRHRAHSSSNTGNADALWKALAPMTDAPAAAAAAAGASSGSPHSYGVVSDDDDDEDSLDGVVSLEDSPAASRASSLLLLFLLLLSWTSADESSAMLLMLLLLLSWSAAAADECVAACGCTIWPKVGTAGPEAATRVQ